ARASRRRCEVLCRSDSLPARLRPAAATGLVHITALAGCQKYHLLDEEIPPRTRLDGVGISFITPDESGWIKVKQAHGQALARFAATKVESYTIQMDYLRSPCPESEEALIVLVKQSLESNSTRFKVRSVSVELNRTRAPFFANYHMLSEDYAASKMPKDQ